MHGNAPHTRNAAIEVGEEIPIIFQGEPTVQGHITVMGFHQLFAELIEVFFKDANLLEQQQRFRVFDPLIEGLDALLQRSLQAEKFEFFQAVMQHQIEHQVLLQTLGVAADLGGGGNRLLFVEEIGTEAGQINGALSDLANSLGEFSDQPLLGGEIERP